MNYQDIGKLYKDKFADFAPQPPAQIWQNVQAAVVTRKLPVWQKVIFAFVGMLAIVSIVYFISLNPQEDQKPTKQNQVAPTATQTKIEASNINETTSQEAVFVQSRNNETAGKENQSSTEKPTTQTKVDIFTNQGVSQTSSALPIAIPAISPQNIESVPEKMSNGIEPVENRVSTPVSPSIQTGKMYVVSRDTSICEGQSVDLYVLNVHNPRWSTMQNQSKIVVTPEYSMQYWVNFTQESGQDTTIYIHVEMVRCAEVHLPTAFTPNGDGLNDVFTATSSDPLSSYQLNIYNANNRIIFSSRDINQGWDGSFNGQPQPNGRYICHLRYTDNNGKSFERKEEILLIRH